jgi:DNA-binding PadR family transcriptional regulator
MTIKYGILALLDRRPMHGYELRDELQAEIGSHYEINFGTLYRHLDRLLDDKCVTCRVVVQSGRPDRKVYSVTENGRRLWIDWLREPIQGGSVLKNDFYVKLVLSFASPIDPRDVIDRQRRSDLRLMQALTKLRRSADPSLQIRWTLLLDAAVFQTEARLKWLEVCRESLAQARSADEKTVGAEELRVISHLAGKAKPSVAAKDGEKGVGVATGK